MSKGNTTIHWQEKLSALIEKAIQLAVDLRDDIHSPELNSIAVNRTLSMLENTLWRLKNQDLEPPDGQRPLSLSRQVTDYIYDVNCPLARAVIDIDAFYKKTRARALPRPLIMDTPPLPSDPLAQHWLAHPQHVRVPVVFVDDPFLAFTAQVTCLPEAPSAEKIGLVVKWAMANGEALTSKQLHCANLRGLECWADFSRSILDDADFTDAQLNAAVFEQASLKGARFANAMMIGARLNHVNLHHANLFETCLREAQMINANLSASYACCTKFQDANLTGADFRNAYLDNATFYDAKLCEADFRGTSLRGANFRDADLRGAKLDDAKIFGADFSNAKFDSEDFLNADFSTLHTVGKTNRRAFFKINDVYQTIRDAALRDNLLQQDMGTDHNSDMSKHSFAGLIVWLAGTAALQTTEAQCGNSSSIAQMILLASDPDLTIMPDLHLNQSKHYL